MRYHQNNIDNLHLWFLLTILCLQIAFKQLNSLTNTQLFKYHKVKSVGMISKFRGSFSNENSTTPIAVKIEQEQQVLTHTKGRSCTKTSQKSNCYTNVGRSWQKREKNWRKGWSLCKNKSKRRKKERTRLFGNSRSTSKLSGKNLEQWIIKNNNKMTLILITWVTR